jgi:phytol kinase
MLAIGDGLAGLIGRSHGGKGYKIWGGTKSFLGNSIFFATALVMTSIFWYYTQGALSIGPIAIVILFSMLLTIIESAFAGGFDNLAVPLASGWVAYLILVL